MTITTTTVTCKQCSGHGYFETSPFNPSERSEIVNCPDCGGSGDVPAPVELMSRADLEITFEDEFDDVPEGISTEELRALIISERLARAGVPFSDGR